MRRWSSKSQQIPHAHIPTTTRKGSAYYTDAFVRKRVSHLCELGGSQHRVRVHRRKHRLLHRILDPTTMDSTEPRSMDFVHDSLTGERPFRMLTVVDHWRRDRPVIEGDFGCKVDCCL
jgi:hypothetical protein